MSLARSCLTKRWLILCVDVVVCLAFAVCASLVATRVYPWVAGIPSQGITLTSLGIWAVCAVLFVQNALILVYVGWRGERNWDFLLGHPSKSRTILVYSVLAIPLVLGVNIVVGALTVVLGVQHNQSALYPLQAGDIIGQVAFGVVATLVVPVSEEVLFRGYLYGKLTNLGSSTRAVGLSALVFAGAHAWSASIGNTTLVVQTFALGLVLGWIRRQSQSIFPSMIAHACNNAFALLFVLSCVNHPDLGCART